MAFEISIKHFERLTGKEVFDILKLRSAVFVVEQNCVYQDPDDADTEAYHLQLFNNNELIACLRILPLGLVYNDMSVIGRVCVNPKNRHTGLADLIMQRAINFCFKMYEAPIKISAQTYLIDFYKNLGFEVSSKPYLEDGIEHVAMVAFQEV
jgi:ElaA protein